ncbi:MAG: DarT ssDNA thymidine ADP-ribosyltransferase family protein [Catonella sp.]
MDNIPSIMRKGLFSNEKAKNIKHTSIAMNEIQDRRKLVKIPNGFIIYRILC